jgi:hypothetical protein
MMPHADLVTRAQHLYDALAMIARGFQTPAQLRRQCQREYGLDYAEALEMAYENMQEVAKLALKGVRRPGGKA